MTATFAAVFVALYVAHQVADHWIQTQHQADCKGRPGWPGRIACAAHVATYTATAFGFLGALNLTTDADLKPGRVSASPSPRSRTTSPTDAPRSSASPGGSARIGSTPSALRGPAATTTRRSAARTPSISPSTTCSCSPPP